MNTAVKEGDRNRRNQNDYEEKMHKKDCATCIRSREILHFWLEDKGMADLHFHGK